MILTLLEPVPPLGKDLATNLLASLPELRPRLFHTQSQEEHFLLEMAGELTVVAPLQDLDELAGTTVLVICSPPDPGRAAALITWLEAHPEVALLDCSQPGIAPAEAVCVVGTALPRQARRRWYRLPDAGLSGPLLVLGALASLDPQAVHLTVLLPVSGLGEEAIGELATQGAARLSGVTPARPRSLPRVLAFDLAPSVRARALMLEAQLAALMPGLTSRVHAVDTGVFFGHAAVLLVRCRARLEEKAVRGLLRGSPGIRLPRRGEGLAASDVVNQDHVVCGDIRVQGEWLSAWLAWDGSRVGGSQTAVELLQEIIAAAPMVH
jgi:hypothetical protein